MKKLLLLPILFLSFTHAETFQCKVVGVTDGDTITCLTDQKKQVKVRLYQIDAPESGQVYGQKAKQALSDMIYGETIQVENKGTDRYKRTLGTIFLEKPMTCKVGEKPPYIYNVNVNLEMIQQGYAWYTPSPQRNVEYSFAEQEAKAAKRGLWVDKQAILLWERTKNNDRRTKLYTKTLKCKNGQVYQISYVHDPKMHILSKMLYLYYKGRKIPLYGMLTNSGVIFYSDNPKGYRSRSDPDIYNWYFEDHIDSVFAEGVSVLQNEKLGVYCELANSKSWIWSNVKE